MSDYLRQRKEALDLVLTSKPLFSYTTPVRVDSLANAKRGQSKWAAVQKSKVRLLHRVAGGILARHLLKSFERERARAEYFAVLVKRSGPRLMDPDNCEACVKGIIDGVARRFGVDDGDPFVRYVVDQEKGPYAVHAALYVRRSG